MNLIPLDVPTYTAADFTQETWWLTVLKAVFIIVFLILNVLLALWVERRTIGRMQARPECCRSLRFVPSNRRRREAALQGRHVDA